MGASEGWVKIPNWLLDDSDLTLHELVVYTVLLRFRNHKTGECFPGMTEIADRARVSRETVKRTIPQLEQKGLIKITKRRVGTKNLSNVYTVAVANEKPAHIWETTKRGQRIPKRPQTRHSECPPAEADTSSRHSQTPPRHSQTPGVGTHSAPNKNQKNQIHEQALRRTERAQESFTFEVEQQNVTEKQLAYLNDLHIFLTQLVPDVRTRSKWEALTRNEATDLINTYWSQMDCGRGSAWESPVDGYHSAYPHLTENGQRWIARGYIPDGQEFAA